MESRNDFVDPFAAEVQHLHLKCGVRGEKKKKPRWCKLVLHTKAKKREPGAQPPCRNPFKTKGLAEHTRSCIVAPYFALHVFTMQLKSFISPCLGLPAFKREPSATYEVIT